MKGWSARMLKGAALVLAAWMALGGPAAAERQTPSGLPVPRYVTLKFDRVNARAGPGDDHKLLWVYHARGMPVQVVAETSEWRRVCDPEGSLAWVHKRTTDGRRAVVNLKPTPIAMRRHPKADSSPAAFLNSRAIATLVRCDAGWCRLKVDGTSGWARDADLWGTMDVPQCR